MVLRMPAPGNFPQAGGISKIAPSCSRIDLDRCAIFEIPAAARPAEPFSATL
jgi:hypothetical protein